MRAKSATAKWSMVSDLRAQGSSRAVAVSPADGTGWRVVALHGIRVDARARFFGSKPQPPSCQTVLDLWCPPPGPCEAEARDVAPRCEASPSELRVRRPWRARPVASGGGAFERLKPAPEGLAAARCCSWSSPDGIENTAIPYSADCNQRFTGSVVRLSRSLLGASPPRP